MGWDGRSPRCSGGDRSVFQECLLLTAQNFDQLSNLIAVKCLSNGLGGMFGFDWDKNLGNLCHGEVF